MREKDIQRALAKQRAYFRSGRTLPVKDRLRALQKLRAYIMKYENKLYAALEEDLGKSPSESYMCEIGMTLAEITFMEKHLRGLARPRTVATPLAQFASYSFVKPSPYGNVLIISPWNYPFLLFISPIVAAIAAGNVVIAKPSHKTPQVAAFLESLVAEVFPQNEVAVVLGAGAELGDKLLALPFDHVFFTGSPKVGAHVAECAARMHAGVTLELGGKSPVIVLDDVKIKDAAKKIAWGKCLNAGQTCIAPDYLLCPSKLVQPLAEAIAQEICKMYGATEEARRSCVNFVHIVESRAVERHQALINDALSKGATAVIGGTFTEADTEDRYTPATVLTGVTPDMKIMESEIFGPILPIIAYDSLDEAIQFVQARPKPLALYIFGKSENRINEVIARTTSGSTCVNHCILQIENLSVPFGGVGMSGTGNYHGFYGFKTFSHERNIMEQGAFDAMNYLYPPYHQKGDKGLRAKIQRFLRAMLNQM